MFKKGPESGLDARCAVLFTGWVEPRSRERVAAATFDPAASAPTDDESGVILDRAVDFWASSLSRAALAATLRLSRMLCVR